MIIYATNATTIFLTIEGIKMSSKKSDKVKVDKTAPRLSNSTPSNNKKVALDTDIKLTFNEAVKAGKGSVVITDGTDTRIIPITDKQISISGKNLIINPSENLHPNSHYIVKISAATITDLAGNNYVSTKVPLSFFTKDGAIPSVPEQPKPPVVDEKPTAPTDNTPPSFVSAKVNGNALILNFEDTDLLSTTTAQANAFNVLTNGAVNIVTDVFVNPTAKTVALILEDSVLNDEIVTVSYTDATAKDDKNALQDLTGNDVASFNEKPVTNSRSTPVVKPAEPKPEASETQIIDISSEGTSDANVGDVLFNVIAGNYVHSISGFDKGDVIDFPNGQTPTLTNRDFSDGKVDLQYATNGLVTIITLTGLDNDVSLYSIESFNAAFGKGSIV